MRGINKKLHKAIGEYFKDVEGCNCAQQFDAHRDIENNIPGGYSMHSTRDSIWITKHQRTQNTIWRTDRKIYPNYAKTFTKH